MSRRDHVRPTTPVRGARAVAAFVALGLALVAPRARASEDDTLLPRPPRPPTLPELSHPHVEIVDEQTLASVTLRGSAAPVRANVQLHRLGLELPLWARRWYANVTWGFAWNPNPSRPAFLPTNVEVGLRGVWSSVTGVGLGGGFGLVIPASSLVPYSDVALLAAEAAAVRPWDRAMFEPETFTFRPYVDARGVFGPVVLQFRQGLDVTLTARDLLPLPQSSYRFAAIAHLFVGLAPLDWLSGGVEMLERYDLDPAAVDSGRPSFAISGNLRVTTRYFQPSIAVTMPLGSPLNALSTVGASFGSTPSDFVAVRIGVVFTGFDPPWVKTKR
jgi:hypothetical protein